MIAAQNRSAKSMLMDEDAWVMVFGLSERGRGVGFVVIFR
jgi:hypothetical protein